MSRLSEYQETEQTINRPFTQAATSCVAKRPVPPLQPKSFDLVWFETSWLAVRNLMQDAPYLETLPEGLGVSWRNVHECSKSVQSLYSYSLICTRKLLACHNKALFKW